MDIEDSSQRIHKETPVKYTASYMQQLTKSAELDKHVEKYINKILTKIENKAKQGNEILLIRVPKKYTKRIIRELKNKYNYYVDGRGESNPFSEFLSFLTNTTVLDIRWDSY